MIEVEGLSKRFRVWNRRPATLRETMTTLLHAGVREHRDHWALRDVSLTVPRGAALGICGANGSGKSTLLRLIARIIRPTHGRITVHAPIASLLELGMGFHPEITGRENIGLSAALLGFTPDETRASAGAIIDFAELGEQIDQPVKTYSAGMHMRLGFAIAAHLRRDILLIDEVLAVGDAHFQAKCLEWLRGQIAQGTTLVIVSHDLMLLRDLCDRVVWMHAGEVRETGDPTDVLNLYMAHALGVTEGATP